MLDSNFGFFSSLLLELILLFLDLQFAQELLVENHGALFWLNLWK